MSPNEQPTRPMAKGSLIAATLGAAVVAALIVLGAILPAEFHKDPLGLGKLSGLSRLWAPADQKVDANAVGVARTREYDIPFRSDVVEIPLGGFLDGAHHDLGGNKRFRDHGAARNAACGPRVGAVPADVDHR